MSEILTDSHLDWTQAFTGIDPRMTAGSTGAEPAGSSTTPGSGPSTPLTGKLPSRPAISPDSETVRMFGDANGRQVQVAGNPDGTVSYTAPPPPVRELTFSGGGAKGSALPGAIRALEENGVLKDTKKVSGASVGSMTAALVASGITADEFTTFANDKATTNVVTDGTGGTPAGLLGAAIDNKGSPLTGDGLEALVKGVMNKTLRKRISEYLKTFGDNPKGADPTVIQIAKRLGEQPKGPTFMDLRQLSKVIPAIKEVVITGCYTTEYTDDGRGGLKEKQDGNQQGKLYVFDADSEPNLPVAVAVHASASFPAAFKPVNIKLSSGLTVQFIDGGVMNNTPTSSSLSDDPDLDPVPDKRGMTFMFQDDDTEGVARGEVRPSRGRGAQAMDEGLGAPYSAAQYATNRDAAEHKDEIVVVPLTATLPPKEKGGADQQIDMRGMVNGTLNFGAAEDAKLALQAKTEQVTNKKILETGESRTTDFASASQMLMCVPLDDLKAMANGGMEGAKQALEFRGVVADIIGDLRTAARDGGDPAANANVKLAFSELDRRAGGDPEFQAYVARELNKAKLGSMLETLRDAPGLKTGVMQASFDVAAVAKVHANAMKLLRTVIYPRMTTEDEDDTATLTAMETVLRKAKTSKEYNEALTDGILAFRSREHIQFAHALEGWMMQGE